MNLKSSLVFLFAFIGWVPSQAQTFRAQLYYEDIGLASNVIYDMTQDHLGRMWFATQGGISWYNGTQWFSFHDSIKLPVYENSRIALDSKGNIWTSGTRKNTFYLKQYKNKRWHNLSLPENAEKNKHASSDLIIGSLWAEQQVILRQDSMIFFFDEEGKFSRSFDFVYHINRIVLAQDRLYVLSDEGIFYLDKNLELHSYFQSEITEYRQVYGALFSPNHDTCIAIGRNWVGQINNGELDIWRDKIPVDGSLSYFVANILEDDHGKIFYSFNRDVYFINQQTGENYYVDLSESLRHTWCNKLYLDQQSNLWIGSHRGLAKFTSFRFMNYFRSNGLIEDEVSAITEIRPGVMALAGNDGLTVYDHGKLLPFSIVAGAENFVIHRFTDITKDDEETVWMASNNLGLISFDTNHVIKRFPAPDEEAVSSLAIINDTIYCSVNHKGLHRFVNGQFELIHPVVGYIRKIIPLSNGDLLLLGLPKSLLISKGQVIKLVKNKIRGRNLYAALEDEGTIWLGSRDGLLKLENGKIVNATIEGFEINKPVYTILKTKEGHYWLGTDNGVIIIRDGEKVHYGTRQGLAGKETNRAALYQSSDGRIWIGTDRGLSIYLKENDFHKTTTPITRLLFMETKRESPYQLDQDLNIPYNENTLEFHFRAISFLDESTIRYRVKLEGFDQDWKYIDIPLQNSIRYTNLPPGQYRFHMEAQNFNELWSPTVSSGLIVIASPFYQAWWFILVSLLAGLYLVYLVFTFLNHRKNRIFLEEKVREKTAEIKLSESRFEAVWESAEDGMMLTDNQGYIEFVNPSLCRLTGLKAEELLQQPYSILFGDNDFNAPFPISKNDIKKGKIKVFEMEMPFINSTPFVEGISTPVGNHSEALVLTVLRDITQRKQDEQALIKAKESAEQASKAKADFLSTMSHEMRTPMNAVVGMTHLLMEDVSDPEQRENVNILKFSAENLMALIDDILDFNKIDSGKVEFEHIRFRLPELIKKVHQSFGYQSQQKNLKLNLYLDPNLPELVIGDPNRLSQVLGNLTNNAIKFTEKGSVTIGCHVMQSANGKATLRFSVRDTGIGIEPEKTLSIFQAFTQARSDITRKYGGTGLGLAIIKKLLELQNSTIQVKSQPGKGSEFYFALSFPVAKDETVEEEVNFEKTGFTSLKGIKVLVVDDLELNFKVVRKFLDRWELKYDYARNGFEAIEKVQDHHFDVVLMDLQMPEMDGYEATKRIRKLEAPEKNQIPIIALTASALLEIRKKVYENGMDDFITKPIKPTDLYMKLVKAYSGELKPKRLLNEEEIGGKTATFFGEQ